jgi:molybdate transport system ATP-binding protein
MRPEFVADFEKRFPGGAVIRAALRLPAEGFTATVLFGPSGCGKTTVVRCLAGLERPERGMIRFGDESWLDAERGLCRSPQRRGVGYLSQDYALFPHLTVAGNVAYGLSGRNRAERRARVAELLERFQLVGLEGRYPHQVSGGQQQRVALARALARRPRLLLLDEPLSALDAPTRDPLRGQLRELLAGFDTPTVLVTHEPIEVRALADQVVILDHGVVRQAGTVTDVFDRPADLSVACIVGVDNVLPGRVAATDGRLATLAVEQTRLVAAAPAEIGPDVHACIRAEQVLLYRIGDRPEGRENVLTAHVEAVMPEGAMIRVRLKCGFLLTALVSRPTFDDLGLRDGQEVTAVFRASAVHLLPRG